MITDSDIEKLSKTFLTKEEYRKSSRNFATTKELKYEIDSLRAEMRGEFQNVHDEIGDMKEMIQGLAVSMDGVIKSISDMWLEY